MKRKNLIIISSIMFLLLLFLYLLNRLEFIDSFVYELIIGIKSDVTTKFMKFITFFASTKFIVGVVIFLFILSIFKGSFPLIFNFVIILESVINSIVKLLVKRARPSLINLVIETTYSFPSGHTMAAVVLYGLIIYLINKTKINKNLKIAINILLITLIILIMVSRIYLGVHFFSDVFAGLFLGLSYLLIMIDILERRKLI